MPLQDGTKVTIDRKDIRLINKVLNNSSQPFKFFKSVTKNRRDFERFYNFACNLKEDFDILAEDSVWQGFKKGAYNGSRIGTVGGGLAGLATGATVGGGVGAASDLGRYLQKKNIFRKAKNGLDDVNNYILGARADLNPRRYVEFQRNLRQKEERRHHRRRRKPVTVIGVKDKNKNNQSKIIPYAMKGAKMGSKFGSAFGAASGAAYGGLIGGGAQLAKNAKDAIKYAITGRAPSGLGNYYANFGGVSSHPGKVGRPRTKPPKPVNYYQYPDGTKVKAGPGKPPKGVKVISILPEEDQSYQDQTVLGSAEPGLDSDINTTTTTKDILKKIKDKKNINKAKD